RRTDQPVPAGARSCRLRVQGLRGRTRRLLFPPRGPSDLPLLAARRRSHYPLARGRVRLRRAAADRPRHLVRHIPMIRFWLFAHLLGFTMWLGGGLAAMVTGVATKREDRASLGDVVRSQSAGQKVIIAPGAVWAVASGLILTFSVSARMGELIGFNLALVVMQVAGLVGALVVLLVGLPTAAKLGRLDPVGPGAAYFDELR